MGDISQENRFEGQTPGSVWIDSPIGGGFIVEEGTSPSPEKLAKAFREVWERGIGNERSEEAQSSDN